MSRMQRFFKIFIVLIILCVAILSVMVNYPTKPNWELYSSIDVDREEIIIVTTCCGVYRVEETLAMVKSAIIFSRGLKLHWIMFSDDATVNELGSRLSVVVKEAKKWDVYFRFEIRPIDFPHGKSWIKWYYLFKRCAAQRLFLPSLLPNVDALLYLDTDSLIVSDIRSIWGHFQKMNSSQVIAVASEYEPPELGRYVLSAKHPFYPPLGVNSGVMLMNLTRLRQFNWEAKVISYYKQYKNHLLCGDQDLINIIFHFHPEKLYVYSCAYNFHTGHCRGNYCKSAESDGIYVVHGAEGSFHDLQMFPFHTIYNIFESFHLSSDDLQSGIVDPIKNIRSFHHFSNCSYYLRTFIFKHTP